MSTKNELLIRIDEKYPKFSKGQKRLADYIKENYDKAAFLTAAKMGEAVGVSESTVVRFATQLGYKGYPEFQKALGELVRTKLNSIQRMEVTYGRIDRSEILATVLQSDIEKIKQTLESVDNHAFELAVDTILAAKKVYVIGIRSCAPLAKFLTFYLNLICEDVVEVDTNSSSEIFEQLIRIGEEDVIIGISFPRYSMRTLKALEFASNRKAKVITLTDSVNSPMNLYSSCNLIAKSDMASIVDSLVAPLSVINALVVANRCIGYINAPSLFQLVVADCLDVKTDVEFYDRNRKLLYESMKDMGFECVKPEGAFYMLVKAPTGDDAEFSAAAKKFNLLIVPATSFGCPGYVRMAYCVSNEMIHRALPALQKLADHYGLKK